MTKNQKRLRRARRTRYKIRELHQPRLTVHRTPRHIYAQVIDADGQNVLAAASTLDRELRAEIKNGGNITAAEKVGQSIAEKAKKAGVGNVIFDRSGFKYHGRVKALADAARENGLEF
ncbi:MAG: 50S ribosomal protein L18 [Gammaproteobacteria bacterium]|nr:MAG: 50S ribosomal protein L18 [Gammaproteobacteria bacterium]